MLSRDAIYSLQASARLLPKAAMGHIKPTSGVPPLVQESWPVTAKAPINHRHAIFSFSHSAISLVSVLVVWDLCANYRCGGKFGDNSPLHGCISLRHLDSPPSAPVIKYLGNLQGRTPLLEVIVAFVPIFVFGGQNGQAQTPGQGWITTPVCACGRGLTKWGKVNECSGAWVRVSHVASD